MKYLLQQWAGGLISRSILPKRNIFIAVFSCINERKQVEETLKENAAYIRTVMDNLPLGIAVSSAKTGIFEYMNDNFCTIYRTAREDIPDTVAFWQKVYEDPAFRDAFRTKVREDCTSGDPKRMLWEEIPIVRRGAETTFVSAANVPVSGKPLTISIAWDVTDRKLAETGTGEASVAIESGAEDGIGGTSGRRGCP